MKDAVRINNVFEDEDFEYIERIFDALIGNLKEYVVVTEDADGNKEFSGKLSDAQIPAVVNAVIAYAAKKLYLTNRKDRMELTFLSLKMMFL